MIYLVYVALHILGFIALFKNKLFFASPTARKMQIKAAGVIMILVLPVQAAISVFIIVLGLSDIFNYVAFLLECILVLLLAREKIRLPEFGNQPSKPMDRMAKPGITKPKPVSSKNQKQHRKSENYALQPLADQLNSLDPAVRRSTGLELKKSGSSSVPALMEVLKKGNVDGRKAAARLLGRIGDPRAIEPLIDVVLGLEPKPLVADAKKALLTIGEPAVPALIQGLKREGVNAMGRAAELLGKIGDQRAVRPLKKGLKTAEIYHRSDVAKALGQIGGEEAIGALIEALGYEGVKPNAQRWLVQYGEEAIPQLEEATGNENSMIARGAQYALKKITGGEPKAAVRKPAKSSSKPKPVATSNLPQAIVDPKRNLQLRLTDPNHPARGQLKEAAKLFRENVDVTMSVLSPIRMMSSSWPQEDLLKATKLLEEGFEKSKDMDILVAKASILRTAMQFKSAEDEIDRVLTVDSNHFEARMWKDHWGTWLGAYAFPYWSPRQKTLSPALITNLKNGVKLQIVRDGLQKSLIFIHDTGGHVPPSGTKIKTQWLLSNTPHGPLVCYYFVMHEPGQPVHNTEAMAAVAKPKTHNPLESYNLIRQMAFVPYIYFVLVNNMKKVVLNQRVKLNKNSIKAIQEIDKKITSPSFNFINTSNIQAASQWHMNNFSMKNLRYD